MSDPDQTLVEACQSASGQDFEEAYQELFALYQDRVFTICSRVTGNREDALDAAQETMITLARRVRDFAFRSRFSSWVFRIAVNAAIDTRRRRLDSPRAGIHTALGSPEQEHHLNRIAGEEEASDPVLEATRTEDQSLVQEALTRLNPRFAALLTLRYMEGLSYDQIAEVQECSVGTVKSRLNRAHGALRELLERSGYDFHETTL